MPPTALLKVVVPFEFTVSASAPLTAPANPMLPVPALAVRFPFSATVPPNVIAELMVVSVAADATVTLSLYVCVPVVVTLPLRLVEPAGVRRQRGQRGSTAHGVAEGRRAGGVYREAEAAIDGAGEADVARACGSQRGSGAEGNCPGISLRTRRGDGPAAEPRSGADGRPDVSAVMPPTAPPNEALPVTVSASAPSRVVSNETVDPFSVSFAVSVTAPLYVCSPVVVTDPAASARGAADGERCQRRAPTHPCH